MASNEQHPERTYAVNPTPGRPFSPYAWVCTTWVRTGQGSMEQCGETGPAGSREQADTLGWSHAKRHIH